MKKSLIVITLILSVVMYNCTDTIPSKSDNSSETSATSHDHMDLGKKLVESQCLSCHPTTNASNQQLAPSMETIKEYYITKKTSEQAFKSSLGSFIAQPSKESSKIPNAVEEYGLMSGMNFTDKELDLIANFIYHHNFKQDKPEEMDPEAPLAVGKSLALKAKATLGKNLMKAIQAKGTAYAVDFCSSRAIHLTDSVAQSVSAKIKRVSDKNRNPNNKANDEELAYIKAAKKAIQAGEKPKPQLISNGKSQTGYYPILTNNMCLQCHGKKSDIAPATLSKIKSLYPNDLAIGYEANEVRGIWVIEMFQNTVGN